MRTPRLKNLFLLAFWTFMTGWLCMAGCARVTYGSDSYRPIASFEGGKLYQIDKIKVLELNGTYRQMGRQYGKLLAVELDRMYQEIIRQYIQYKVTPTEEHLQQFSANLFRLYPYRFQEIAMGISETSKMPMEKIAVLNEFFDELLAAASSPQTMDLHCSAMTAWGPYTGNAPLVMGRNFDFPNFFRNFDPYITVVVYNPSDGGHSAAVLTWPGQIGSIQAFNDSGLVLENNDGSSCGDKARYFGERTPFLIQDLAVALDYSAMEGLDAALKTSRLHYPLIYNVADTEKAYCYEMATYEVKRRQGENEGLVVGVNHFISPGWPTPPPEFQPAIEDSTLRHNNLLALAEKSKGKMDAVAMMKILDTLKEDGGATPKDTNIYQFVAVPKELTIWVKALTYSDWVRIDLGAFFHN